MIKWHHHNSMTRAHICGFKGIKNGIGVALMIEGGARAVDTVHVGVRCGDRTLR